MNFVEFLVLGALIMRAPHIPTRDAKRAAVLYLGGRGGPTPYKSHPSGYGVVQ